MFDPVGMAGLSEEAAALGPAEIRSQARIAERLLRVEAKTFDTLTGTDREAWADMVLLQIRYQLQVNPALVEQRVGELQERYRAGGPVSPDARLIRDAFFGGATVAGGGSWGLDAVDGHEV